MEYFIRLYAVNEKGRYASADTVSVTPKSLVIVSWATGSDEDIATMLEEHYAGLLDVSDYWSLGDIRPISISSIPVQYVRESQPAQTANLMIIGFNHDDLSDGSGKAAITVCHDKYLSNLGVIHYSGTVNYIKWSDSQRRSWCNDSYINALPEYIKNMG